MKTPIKLIIALITGVAFGVSTSNAQLTGTCSIASYGKNYITVLATVTGTNGAASGGNLVNPTFVYNTTDGGTTLATWTNSITPTILPPLGNGGSYTVTIGGLSPNTLYYARVLFSQPDGGTNLVTWSGATQSATTAMAAPPQQIALTNSTIVGTTISGASTLKGSTVSNNTLFIGTSIKIECVTNNVRIINGTTTNHSYFTSTSD